MCPEILTLFSPTPGGAELYAALEEAILRRFPDVEIRPRRTQVGFFHGCGFAWAWPARRKRERDAGQIGLTLGLPAPVTSPRIAEAVEPYPGRWTHHTYVDGPGALDGWLMDMLREAYDFALAKTCRNGGKKVGRDIDKGRMDLIK